MAKKCFHYNWGGYCALCGKQMYNKGLGVDLYKGKKFKNPLDKTPKL